MGHRARRRDARSNRDAILDAAVDVLVQDADAPFERIVAATGFGRATVYRHFPSREALLAALFEEALEEARELMGAAAVRLRDEQADVLVAVQEMVWSVLHSDVRFRRLSAADGRFGDVLTRNFRDYVLALVERGQRRGQITDDLPPEVIGRAIRGVTLEIIRATHDGAATPEDAAVILRRVYDALRPPAR